MCEPPLEELQNSHAAVRLISGSSQHEYRQGFYHFRDSDVARIADLESNEEDGEVPCRKDCQKGALGAHASSTWLCHKVGKKGNLGPTNACHEACLPRPDL